MKILHLTNNLVPGGAGKAARMINEALKKAGVDSNRLDVPMKTKADRLKSIYRRYFDKLPLQFYKRDKKSAFSTANIGIGLKNFVEVNQADIIQIHWVQDGYLGIDDLNYLTGLGKRVYITMHDSWWLSGGCQVTHGCNKWLTGCGACPQLNSSKLNDLSRKIFNKKRQALIKLNPVIICVSNWMYERAKLAPMYEGLKIVRIPGCIDLEKFFPVDTKLAREKLKLPADKKIIMFGSMDIADPNKGYKYFKQAVNSINNDSIEIAVFGNIGQEDLGLNKKVNYLGLLKDDYSLACAYSAADVFVAPSLEDNFPNTVLESLACGTPVTAFNIGGMPDMISHEKNGYLSESQSSDDLAKGISYCITNKGNISTFARKRTEELFSFEAIARSYAQLFK